MKENKKRKILDNIPSHMLKLKGKISLYKIWNLKSIRRKTWQNLWTWNEYILSNYNSKFGIHIKKNDYIKMKANTVLVSFFFLSHW
jgi:hypothetical protein